MLTIIQEGLLYGVLAMGTMLTYRIMGISDLSVDGTYPLGVVVSAVLIVNGVNPWLALVVSFIAGALAGMVTGILHVKLKITSLLSGILVMTGLYSINMLVGGGKSNIHLFGEVTLLDTQWLIALNAPDWVLKSYPIAVFALIALGVKLGVDWLLRTRVGYLLKITGDNEGLVMALGENLNTVKILGLAVSNGLIGLCGGMMASFGRYYDISLGTGMVIMGLLSVLLGTLVCQKTRLKLTTQVIIGATLYRAVISWVLSMGLDPMHLKLVTVVIFVIAIVATNNPLSHLIKRKETPHA